MLRPAIAAFVIALSAATSAFAVWTGSEAVMQKFSEQEKFYQLPDGVLAKIAKIESNGNSQALNSSTQAGGLFQWIPRYWYNAASKVFPAGSGALDPQSRFNPLIATEVTAYNLAYIRTLIGTRIQQAKADQSVGLYMGHFLGAAGAGKFFAVLIQDPNGSAAQYFPNEARYNQSVFSGRSVAGVYNLFASKMNQPGISGVSNYASTYDGPTTGRIMDTTGNLALARAYTGIPPASSVQTYPTTYNQTQDAQAVNSYFTSPAPPISGATNSSPYAALIIAQPDPTRKGDSIVVSWTSVGMKENEPCKVYIGDAQFLAQGNQGTRFVPASGFTQRATFSLSCTSLSGSVVERSTSVVVR